MIKGIQEAVRIPVMAKCRIGHFVEAQNLQAIVKAVTNYHDAKLIAELSEDLGEAMVGINPGEIKLIMEERGK